MQFEQSTHQLLFFWQKSVLNLTPILYVEAYMRYDLVMHELGSWQSPMLRQVFNPQPALSPFIKNYCILKEEWVCDHNQYWYILPDNSAYLIFYLAERNGVLRPSLRLIGPRSSHIIINRHNRHFTFMVSFKPGGLAPLCKAPLADLCDRSTNASDLFPWCDEALIDQLTVSGQNSNLSEFIDILERALLSAFSSSETITPLISHFSELSLVPQIRVSYISDRLGITERHLRTLSQKHIGHSPKLMLQIERFTRSLIISNNSRAWSSIAHDSGYYDQSHMIAEYQKMTGKSPERLFG